MNTPEQIKEETYSQMRSWSLVDIELYLATLRDSLDVVQARIHGAKLVIAERMKDHGRQDH